MPYFVGSDERYHDHNVNNLLYLTAMEHAVRAGCNLYDFGRSRVDNAGACAFKRHHGFDAELLEYQTYVPGGATAPDLSAASARFRWARRCWPRLPLALTRPLGAHLARHLPG